MSMNDKTKLKVKLIVKTYLIIKKQATPKDLCAFINSNFNMGAGITSGKLARIIKSSQRKSCLLEDVTTVKESVHTYYQLNKNNTG